MRRMRKLLGVTLLLSILSLGGASAFADGTGVTEAPTRSSAQSGTATMTTETDASTDILFTTIVSLMTTLPL